MKEKEKLEKIREMSKMLYGKATCPVCGTEFWRTTPNHKFCSDECAKIGKIEQDRLKRCQKNPFKSDWVLDMSKPIKEWKWKKIERRN